MKLATLLLCASISVIDGDTFICDSETIRLKGVDTPETHRAKCEAELLMGLVAKHRLTEMLAEGIMAIHRDKRPDRYGRTIARVITPNGDVGQRLIDEGYAREWRGKRESWCR